MISKKGFLVTVVSLILFILLASIHLSQGQASAGYLTFWKTLFTDESQITLLLYNRLPRFVMGCLAGSALAVAGMLMQTLTKNPLASASTLGIHAGTYFFVVLATIFAPVLSGNHPLLVSFSGGLITASIVWLLVGKTLDPVRVALTGLIIGMLFASFTAALQLLFANEVTGLFLWGSGTLLQLDWSGVRFAWPILLIALSGAILIHKKLDILALGEEMTIALGEKVTMIKLSGWLIAIFLAATTVAAVGPIGFVGIIAPHIVRLLGFKQHLGMIMGNLIMGALLLVSADILVRLISQTSELPVGAMTAIIGGPWLIYLAIKMGKQRSKAEGSLVGNDLFKHKKSLIVGLSIVSLVIMSISLLFGSNAFTPLNEIMNELLHNVYVWDFRVPRVLVSFFVGMLMAASGVLLQAVLRNPLADASILGVTSGAGVTAMLVVVALPGISVIFIPIAALVGAFLAMGLILLLSYRSGFQPVMLVLIGVSISAVGSAFTQIIMVKAKLHVTQVLTWLSGSTYASTWDDFLIVSVTAVIIIPVLFVYHRTYDVLLFSDDRAVGLGLPLYKLRLALLVVAVTMTAVSVSVVGTIGFIGLLAPHAARYLVGASHKYVLPVSLLMGGLILVLADLLGRYLLAPNEIPAGLLVSLIGAPYLLYVLHRSGRINVNQ